MNNPLISIIIVCYNYAHLLPRTLDAIAKQTFQDFEVIFVNNGSQDDSQIVAEQFFAMHPEIQRTLVSIEINKGPANGDNQGVLAANGEYLFFNDADDWMDPNCLELLVASAKSNMYPDRVLGSFRDVNDAGKILQNQIVSNAWINTMQQANLFKRKVYKENSICLKDRLWLDADKVLRFNAVAESFSYVEEVTYNYLVHTDSTSRNKDLSKKIWSEDRYSFELFIKDLRLEVGDMLADEETKTQFIYQMIRLYYSYIFQFLRNASLSSTFSSYSKLHRIMKTYFPDYLRNPYILIRPHLGIRLYARMIVWGSAMFERCYVMKPALAVYHVLSKFIYFSV